MYYTLAQITQSYKPIMAYFHAQMNKILFANILITRSITVLVNITKTHRTPDLVVFLDYVIV